MVTTRLDPIDRKILSELQADGRMTNVELAKRVGISAPPCLRRLRALEEAGLIRGYHAEVNSRDQGRLGALFRIRGRHDPPQRQELRITLAEFISREFLNREMPLPSGTGIDLTLDTTLNVNQLVSDLLALNRARNGQATPTPVTP